LKRSGPFLFGATVLSNTIRELRFLNSAMAQGPHLTDYKALICVFLNGGNDSNNMIIPTMPEDWANYAAIRTPVLAIPNTDGSGATALAMTSKNGMPGYPSADGRTYGFHPAMPELQALFNAGKVAPVFNVGSLAFPLTKAQYQANKIPRPPQLFSHSDQQTQWQTSLPDQPNVSGWGGRVADMLTTPLDVNDGGQISMAVTLAGSNIFEVGNANAAPQYAVTTSGAVTLSSSIPGTGKTALQAFLTHDKGSANLQTKAYAEILDHGITSANLVQQKLTEQANANPAWLTNFPTNSTITTPNGGRTFNSGLMNQMKMVARLIELGSKSVAAGGLGMKRQIFFIQVGGYDTHTNQTSNAGATTEDRAKVVIGSHADLYAELSRTLFALNGAMTQLGLVDKVTSFTTSDFNRTFPCNGFGSDHGWGGHQIVVGGAVKGQATYGKYPTLTVNGPDDTSTGRWIPTTSVDQYAATLARWFGVDDSNMDIILPNLGRFATPNLGFMG
ncbi:MAG TPA: DUF1501 domain-containing protein, partial [Luteolibacter sp.]|nr:DUF1501 domain-containing protein [Luteolibacter sp.]